MNFAFIIDPPSSIKKQKDTSYFLMSAAVERGHSVFYLDQDSLFYESGEVGGEVYQIDEFANWPEKPISFSLSKMKLSQMDVIFIRKDPPFDRRYFYTTLLLDLLPSAVKVVNRPQAVRDWNEKISALFFSQYCPPTLISNSYQGIADFAQKHQRIVLKPIDGHGGKGIHIIRESEWNQEMHAQVTAGEGRKIMVQKYVDEAMDGDKRILLFKGEPLGAILRVAAQPGGLNNLDQGGKAVACELSDHDHEVCLALSPVLKDQGLDFVGIDLLGPYLTEINVTSPTGLQELSRFTGKNYHHQVIEAYE